MGLKSDIENKCAEYEKSKDASGLRAYLTGLQKADPKPEGWGESVDELIKTWLAKAQTMLLKAEIAAKYRDLLDKKEVDGASTYLSGLLSVKQKPTGWDSTVETHVRIFIEGLKDEIRKCRCEEIWQKVKVALDERNFATARQLTSTAEPYADEELRLDILKYRVGLLNEVVNPYQTDVIINEMQTKFRSFKDAGQVDQAKAFLATVEPIRDSFPSIEQKVIEIAPSLKGLYWLDSRVSEYLQKHIAEIQAIMDARGVSGECRDYKAVYDLVDAAVAEMKLYNPKWDKDTGMFIESSTEANWETSMKSVRRVMTTAAANNAIEGAKAALLKSIQQ